MQSQSFTHHGMLNLAILLCIQAMITVQVSEATVYRCKGPSGSVVLTDRPTQREQCIALPGLPLSSALPPTTSTLRTQTPSVPDYEHGVREVPVPEADKPDEVKTDTPPINGPQASPNSASPGSMPNGNGEDNSQKRLTHINPLNPFLPVPVEPGGGGQ
jgi:hypothetical protein